MKKRQNSNQCKQNVTLQKYNVSTSKYQNYLKNVIFAFVEANILQSLDKEFEVIPKKSILIFIFYSEKIIKKMINNI